MRAAKRFWIYSGLGVPEGVALVRRTDRGSASKRILLIGGTEMQGLTLPLASLMVNSNSALHIDLRDASLRQWASNDWLNSHLAVFRPTAVFVALDPRDSLARQAVRARIRRHGARDVWLVPPGIPWHAARRYVPAPELNAEGYALWAGRALSVVK
jgi:hypothetical protein